MASDSTEVTAPQSFAYTVRKAWTRVVELVVYDPTEVDSSAILQQGGQQFGLLLSGLHVDFIVTRSQTYSENTAEFKVYNASEATRRQMVTPGRRVRFSVGHKEQGDVTGIFWGTILKAPSSKVGNDWVTTMTCVSSLTEATGTGDIASWAKKHPKATNAQKQEIITAAVNRIPVGISYGPDAPLKGILRDLATITGLVLNGSEGMPDILLPNGFVYVGGSRGALKQVALILRRYGWTLYIDNTGLLIVPQSGGNVKATAAYLTYKTGLIEVKETTSLNIPPKVDKNGKRIQVPKSYEFKAIINPKIGPNTLVQFNETHVQAQALVGEAKFTGNNYGGEFTVSGKCVAWSGPGDTLRKAP